MVDYRFVLKRYIQHVMDCEGISFLTPGGQADAPFSGGVEFTEAECKAVREIVEEIDSGE